MHEPKKTPKDQKGQNENEIANLELFIQKKKIQNDALKKIMEKLNNSDENK